MTNKENTNGNQGRLSKMETVKHKETVQPISLLELTKRFLKDPQWGCPIKKPPHQRDYIWSPDKERSWIYSIIEQNMAPNLIALYFIDPIGDLEVNDGMQRLSASVVFLKNPGKYGLSEEDAISALSKTKVPVDTRQYENNDAVMFHFMIMQQGTQVTAYEAGRGTLVYMEQYEIFYESILDKIEKIVDGYIAILTNGAKNDSRVFRHKCLRDNLALFLRFATKEITFRDYESNIGSISINNVTKSRYLEVYLRDYFEKTPREKIEKDVSQFNRVLKEITGLLDTVWGKELRRNGKIEETCVRFLFDVGIWATNKNLDMNEDYRKFVRDILVATGGGGQFPDPDPGRGGKSVILKMGGVAILKGTCQKLRSDFYDCEPYQKQKNDSQGIYHVSHIIPEKEGGTETVLQDAFGNRALGANRMPKDMEEMLRGEKALTCSEFRNC